MYLPRLGLTNLLLHLRPPVSTRCVCFPCFSSCSAPLTPPPSHSRSLPCWYRQRIARPPPEHESNHYEPDINYKASVILLSTKYSDRYFIRGVRPCNSNHTDMTRIQHLSLLLSISEVASNTHGHFIIAMDLKTPVLLIYVWLSLNQAKAQLVLIIVNMLGCTKMLGESRHRRQSHMTLRSRGYFTTTMRMNVESSKMKFGYLTKANHIECYVINGRIRRTAGYFVYALALGPYPLAHWFLLHHIPWGLSILRSDYSALRLLSTYLRSLILTPLPAVDVAGDDVHQLSFTIL
jgi:hypothetical protein